MADQEVTPTIPPSRSARFKRHLDTEMLPTDMTLGRRAEFRPSEQIAARRDVIEAFRQGMIRDIGSTMASEEVRDRSALAAALADEATRNHDRAALSLARLRRQAEFWPEEWAIVRRVHRRLGDPEVVAEALERPFGASRGIDRALTGLERARHGWEHGEDPKQVAKWVRRAMSEFDNGGRRALQLMPRHSAAWAVQLACDAAFEAGQNERALRLMDAFLDHPELEPEDRQTVAATLGLWHYALGDCDKALEYLRAVGETGALRGDFEDAFVHLLFLDGDRETARAVLARCADQVRQNGPRSLVLAMLESCAGRDDSALEALRSARERADDPVVLDLCLEILEQAGTTEELIDVLNQRLDTPGVGPERRAALLARLGRLYESDAGLEEAAADVYREALELVPDYAPAIRALGRLYSRRRSWQALAQLFEHEVAALAGSPTVWRRRYQVARLYEVEIGDAERALVHYRAVLEARPAYLPAIKGAARLLAGNERWGELAELFLEAAGAAVSNRQKLYLLDRVAEVAELRLRRYDVAIGAWEEILHMDPHHPRAFSALGRLYAQTERWHDLLRLNERELELVDDEEETAALLVRNAEIAELELGRPDLAEPYYRQVLETLPDYLPALEGLGRIYARGGRWDAIASMTDAQLSATDDPREAQRQLGALAELFEAQLESRDDAIEVYERLLAAAPEDSHTYFNLLRLYRQAGRWQDAFDLVERHRPTGWEGELAMIAEWRLSRWDVAFNWYMRALEKEPACPHWLEGIARLWRPARIAPGELADRVEGLLMAPMPGTVRDRYFLVLARLREAAEGTPDAGRAYRAHGDEANLESRVVMRLAMATNSEREALTEMRRLRPVFSWDEMVNADRVRPTRELIEQLACSVGAEERAWLMRETDLGSSHPFVGAEDGAWTRLAAEMQRVLQGPPSDEIVDVASAEILRLRAVEALASDDLSRFRHWTLLECEATTSREIRVHRLVELAEQVPGDDRAAVLHDAVRAAFWELVPDDQIDPVVDGPVYDRLYDALQDNRVWDAMRMALEVHVRREGLPDARRAYLSEMLGRVCEDQHEDFVAARASYEKCWAISRDVRYLRDVVRVAHEEGDLPLAIAWQAKHYHEVAADGEATPDARLQSALWHAELLRIAGRGGEAIAFLEDVLQAESEGTLGDVARRELARLHTQFGEAVRAVELFQQVLPVHATVDDIDDWRTMVHLHAARLGDISTAYALQWKLVRAQPTSREDLDTLVDFALDLDEVADCCAQLEALAGSHEGDARLALLGRAAIAFDEDLNWAEEAVRLYEGLIAETKDDEVANTELRRRHAFSLSRIAGREGRALDEFRRLAFVEPFEPSTYRGMVDLLERTQAYDRARVANQLLAALGCEVDGESERGKTTPSRAFEPRDLEELLLPDGLRGGILGCLRALLPLAEKIWSEELPQRKALDGDRIREGKLYEAVVDALSAFGIKKFKLLVGDAGPLVPQVFADGTIWINRDVVDEMSDAERRFLAGYCASLMWSDLSMVVALEGRALWHLLEGVQLRQTGRGFSDRVDVESQRLGEETAGPLFAVARRRVAQAIDNVTRELADVHCELWPQQVEDFARRTGMVLCGDIPASLRAVLRLQGWDGDLADSSTQARVRRTASADDLLRFASTDEFLLSRHVIGLAGKPSSLTI